MRHSLRPPIPELALAATLLAAAADALVANRRQLAGQLLACADFPELAAYLQSIVGPLSLSIHGLTKVPKALPLQHRDPTRMPNAAQQDEIFVRDGWRCRFCGTRVICKQARRILVKHFPTETRWTSREYQRHTGLNALASSLDHVVPHTRGGKNHPSNFVTACYCCQFGRGNFLLAEVEIENPLLRAPIVDGWDGLTRLRGFRLQQ